VVLALRFAFGLGGNRNGARQGVPPTGGSHSLLNPEGPRGGSMLALWLIVALLILFAVIGGVAITKFLFLILIIAAIVALFGLFTRTA
jgi:hypothetical protein